MDNLPDSRLLKFHSDSLMTIRKMYGFNNAEDLDKAIDTFDDWVKKQNHFVKKDYSRDYLERGIIISKGSVEIAKSRMDKLCTMRTLIPHFFGDYDIERDFNFSKVKQVMLPKLTKDHIRVFWCKVDCDQFTPSLLLNLYRLGVVIAEYVRSRGYVGNVMAVYDLRSTNLADFLMNIQINDLHQMITILLNGYGLRVAGINFLTSSKLIEGAISLIKPMLSSKISQRINIHKDLESLYEFVSKEILPVEYGGEEKPLEEIYADWVEEVNTKEFKEHWMEMCGARTDESLRQTDKFNEEYMGMPGSFRTLSVD